MGVDDTKSEIRELALIALVAGWRARVLCCTRTVVVLAGSLDGDVTLKTGDPATPVGATTIVDGAVVARRLVSAVIRRA